ncbi:MULTISPECIES: L,D-transpeptidase family protein [unclassified Rhizobium]|uniref:L,D-transpeptidase family protein n=1 Tax=unclassified Rhizobium TaxID=2613769 RepID=UPI001C83B911|nr:MULTISPECIES: L,D-transpeptidase family protein [unclassified Rhizobium]MBX5157536.1 L,D-transpeptidase family protein [Rhizobium sp. NZLR8]MBX5163272.1 L,D-transpeptidase family protein [Rhizobium sp. NZLR4b]MBX5168712.1 L,D-transpeptidase family protein [Rhizobium sp. NZLR1b]MBX5183811.1 L,D-transpeptidase family protein [Rhizobium sp. NZLR5]MBX5188687.1 L,D-transpeptidase family protein [Rhizobium sp. NZLR3b]
MFSRLVFGLGLLSATALVHPALAADARTLQIIVSKDRQSLAVYDGTEVVATSKVSTGKDGHTTPSGIFSVLEKQKYHESNLYSAAPMPFMQRLTWSGIALHESNSVPRYPASHGCVRMPGAFAKMLYGMTEPGIPVIISDGQVAPQPIDHPTLFHRQAPAPMLLLSDVELRPSMPDSPGTPVQVAMNDTAAMPMPAASPITAHEPEPPSEPISMLITRRTLRETIIDIQALLNQLGFSAGDPDGLLGPSTVQAIKTFKTLRPAEFVGDRSLVSDALLREVYAAAGKGEPPNGVIMVRRAFKPIFEAPVTIADPGLALGTHFFTLHAVDETAGTADWLGITLENNLSRETMKRLGITNQESSIITGRPIVRSLSRITIPEETRRRIDALIAPGSTLTISDTGLGRDTGDGTDFITITRG